MANNTGQKFGGRKKGTPNKTTRQIKEAIIEAFELEGGVDYLRKVAAEDSKTFCALLGKVLPMQITGEDGGKIEVNIVRFGSGQSTE